MARWRNCASVSERVFFATKICRRGKSMRRPRISGWVKLKVSAVGYCGLSAVNRLLLVERTDEKSSRQLPPYFGVKPSRRLVAVKSVASTALLAPLRKLTDGVLSL